MPNRASSKEGYQHSPEKSNPSPAKLVLIGGRRSSRRRQEPDMSQP
ncbi:unnamed protein product [Brassica oleracea]